MLIKPCACSRWSGRDNSKLGDALFSSLYSRSNTQLRSIKHGLVLQISTRVLL